MKQDEFDKRFKEITKEIELRKKNCKHKDVVFKKCMNCGFNLKDK